MNRTIFSVIAILIIVAGAFYFFQNHQAAVRGCTQEAMLCPDGSAVGRTGPNCEFAPCPSATTTPSVDGWSSHTDAATGVTYSYPESMQTTYIDLLDWPPAVQVLDASFVCSEGGTSTARAGETKQTTINGREYCVTVENEGAAGSMYSSYAYATGVNDKTVILTFSTRTPQCMNYDDPKQTECKKEVDAFSMDVTIDRIFGTLNFQQ